MKTIFKPLLLLIVTISIIANPASGQLFGQTKAQEMAAFIKKQSQLMAKRSVDWAKDKTADILLDGVKEFIQKNKLDQNTAGKILSSMAQNKEALQQIYDGVSATDVQGAALSAQLLIGKIIAENVPESNMSTMLKALTKYPDVAAEASQAMGSIAGGDYYKGSETIGRLIWKHTAIGKGIDKAISVEKAGWDFLIQNQYDAAYQKYKEQGSDGLVRMFSGPAAYIREKYFQGRSVSNEMIEAKMTELFEAAKKNEAAALAEQTRLESMYGMFQRMEMESGVIFDFRKHWEQYGVTKESEVFDKFLWLSRLMRRDLLSVGLDSWELGRTPAGGNPAFSSAALSLLLAYVQGGAQGYKNKFDEIARARFPQKAKPVTVEANKVEPSTPVSLTLELPGYWGHLSYTISGAKLETPTGSDRGNVGGRHYIGKLLGNTVIISGTAVSDNESSGPDSGDYYQLLVSVVNGMQYNELLSYIAPKGEKLNKSFSFTLPYDKSTSKVVFRISLLEHNKNYGNYGWDVSGYLTW